MYADEVYTDLEANSARSFQNAFYMYKCSRALNYMFFKNCILDECNHFSAYQATLSYQTTIKKNMLGSRFRVVVSDKIREITENIFDDKIFETTLTNIFGFHFTCALVEVVIFLKLINNSSS